MEPVECFIVMPFGVKQFPDGSGRRYDFDKVYRVVIQRAVREAGMTPIRADERMASALIHSDMFRDLRDRAVVLADLSLDNPNVFYELGIRHVMSASGTVLICRKGSILPFDVKLSRTIFYEFDGSSLDWEEVERIVKHLKVALQEAQKGLPDSPVHALLQSVQRLNSESGAETERASRENAADAAPLDRYQALVAEHWLSAGEGLMGLFEEHRGSVFGSRALGKLCLETDPLSDAARRLANHLNDAQQYQLANDIYSRLHEAKQLTPGSLLAYASSHTEAHPDLDGADRGIALAREALSDVERQYPGAPESPDAVIAFAECYRRLAGLRQWRWQITREEGDLQDAVVTLADAIRYNEKARRLGRMKHPGFLAQLRIKEVVLLRIQDANIERPDFEGHRDAILALKREEADDKIGLSYLGWFQAITLADMGASDASERKALSTIADDAALRTNPRYWTIGRRQYTLLRRFLEQYAPHLRHSTLIGRISQILQAGEVS
ncbi:hypothetical protein [Geodermatophilus sp. URMC 62]|uniref:hypothetical protein n=1 Tax=Geodermatophilus sp. URMC 62 TaxID=3423414 RepID=UPI00406CDEDF